MLRKAAAALAGRAAARPSLPALTTRALSVQVSYLRHFSTSLWARLFSHRDPSTPVARAPHPAAVPDVRASRPSLACDWRTPHPADLF